MIVRHLATRQPRGRGFAWGRRLSMDGSLLTINLFRRDMRGALHQKSLQYVSTVATRKTIADDLRRARAALADRVLRIDLELLEAA